VTDLEQRVYTVQADSASGARSDATGHQSPPTTDLDLKEKHPMNLNVRRLAALAGTAAITLVVAGTASAASPQPLTAVVAIDSTSAPDAGQAWVRVLHGSPDAPAVDVYVDGTKAITGLVFGKITDYTPVPAGDHAIKVCATGSTTVCPIDLPKIAVADGKKYTIAATDRLANISAKVIVDAPAAPTADTTQLRVVHFSADTPAVDVFADGATVVTGIAYPNATDYLAVPGATYSVKVCAAADNSVCPIGPVQLTLENGKAYSVFAVGSLAAATATPVVTAAAPVPTAPATDALATSSSDSSSTGSLASLATIAAIAFASILLGVRLATRTARH
jgi:hypothetical protein